MGFSRLGLNLLFYVHISIEGLSFPPRQQIAVMNDSDLDR